MSEPVVIDLARVERIVGQLTPADQFGLRRPVDADRFRPHGPFQHDTPHQLLAYIDVVRSSSQHVDTDSSSVNGSADSAMTTSDRR